MWNQYASEIEAVVDALRLARGMTYKVCRIYENMERDFKIADRHQIPTYLAADRMAEERIRQIAEVKKYAD